MSTNSTPATILSSLFSFASARSVDGSARADAHRDLLHTLFIELFQTEQSADVHSRREADRLGDEAPANALRAVADHARTALIELNALAKPRGFAATRGGMLVGSLFSSVRDLVADRLIDRERSYRGTLLGMRHGMDLVRSIRFVAEATRDTELALALDAWLLVRLPLVDRVSDELAWFARHPERALEGSKGFLRSTLGGALGMG